MTHQCSFVSQIFLDPCRPCHVTEGVEYAVLGGFSSWAAAARQQKLDANSRLPPMPSYSPPNSSSSCSYAIRQT
jgi:hypothetical protein